MNSWLTIVLCALLFWQTPGCVPKSVDMSAADAGKPKLPPIFGVSLDANPEKLVRRLIELGYQREEWSLNAPYSKVRFALSDEASTFQTVELLLCNYPQKIAGIRMESRDLDRFYAAVKERFGLGLDEWDKDGSPDVRHGRYVRDFVGNTRVVLTRTHDRAEFTLDARDVQALCVQNLENDVQALRAKEEAEREAWRTEQRKSF
ncbi:MAG: hypothetical protein IJU76_12315 [Desulfovibrionaceae bacterium]|nr:hypothetical protein [Desulfovibrionaceae bacterium]